MLHGKFETSQIEFSKCVLFHHLVDVDTIGFLTVGYKMFDARSYTIALNSIDVGGSHVTGEYQIFGDIFEVATTQRNAVYVHARCQEHISAIFQYFVTHSTDSVRILFFIKSWIGY